MKIIIAVDESYGLLFNNRRVSRDKILCSKVETMIQNNPLWMNNYSSSLWKESTANIRINEDFLSSAQKEDYCFVEDKELIPFLDKIEEIIMFHWNRKYPSDFKLDMIPREHGFSCVYTEEFKGNSHENITMERWIK